MGNSRQFIVGVVNQKRTPVVPEPFVPTGPEMIMTWDTTKTGGGSSASNQINLPLRGAEYVYNNPYNWMDFGTLIPASTYDFWVDWGDGAGYSTHITAYNDANKLHTYGTTGVKTVKVKGQFGSFNFNDSGDKLKLSDISKFDGMVFDNCYAAFKGCANLNFTATDAPVLALNKTTLMSEMFMGALKFNANIGNWNVSAATSMYCMFNTTGGFGTPMKFNNGGSSSIGSWNVSKVEIMGGMFQNNSGFTQNIGAWNVSKVKRFDGMFYYNSNFNNGGSPSISGWTVSAATSMANMFASGKFNQPIGAWNVSNVTGMTYMFSYSPFNQPLNSWNTGKVVNMSYMFTYNTAFNQNIGAWNVSKVANFSGMLNGVSTFNNGGSGDIGGWNTSGATDMQYMFNGAALNQNIGAWNVGNVTNFSNMFRATNYFNNGGSSSINNWNTAKATNMYFMFYYASAFNQPISNWNVSKVTNFGYMFNGAGSFNQPLSGWTFSTISNISFNRMFTYASAFNQNIGMWNVKKVTDMSYMFNGAYAFNNGGSPSISGWTTSGVTNMSWMFYGNWYFAQDINAWDVRKVTNMSYMFAKSDDGQTFSFNYKIYNWQPLALTSGAGSGMANMFDRPTQVIPTPIYNQILINYAGLGSIPSTITAKFGGGQYSGATATSARTYLTGTKGWIITDGGLLP